MPHGARRLNIQRPHRLGVRTPPFHGGNTGSIPVGDASVRRPARRAGLRAFVPNGHFAPVGFDCRARWTARLQNRGGAAANLRHSRHSPAVSRLQRIFHLRILAREVLGLTSEPSQLLLHQ